MVCVINYGFILTFTKLFFFWTGGYYTLLLEIALKDKFMTSSYFHSSVGFLASLVIFFRFQFSVYMLLPSIMLLGPFIALNLQYYLQCRNLLQNHSLHFSTWRALLQALKLNSFHPKLNSFPHTPISVFPISE